MRKTTLLLTTLALCVGAWAAEDAALTPQQAASLKPQAASYGTEAITIPQMLSYQGKLTDTFGLPVADTLYTVRFRLYAQPTGGTQFWEENQNVRTTGGLFSVLLGSTTPIGSVPDAGALYLGMAVAGGAELSPRLRIASAAYAYLTARAANADLLQGRDTTTFSRSTHNHDATYVNEAQANSVTGAMLVDATVKTADIGDTAVTMAKLAQAGATTGEVIKWTGSVWEPGPDNTGGGSGVTNVYEDTGIVCVPNPITSTGNVKLNLTYSDGRYVNEAQSNSVTSAMITDGNVTSADIRDTTVNTAELKDAAVTAAKLNQMGATSGQVIKWTGSAWAPRNDSVGGGSADNAWVRVGSDSVLYTIHRLGIARGEANNALYGTFRQSHVNLGVSCTTGVSGQNYSNLTIGGGIGNVVGAAYSTVAGGLSNRAIGIGAAVAGGAGNAASGDYSSAVGGYGDTTLALCGGVLSGYLNTAGNAASDTCALVAGGYRNRSTGRFSSVGGGASNSAGGAYATVPGGSNCMATGDYSFAAGRNIQANRRGCFAWSDASPSTIGLLSDNLWLARASGGVTFYTDSSLASGSRLPAGGSSWNPVLDSLNMADFRAVDRQVLLEALARMRVREYSLKSQESSIRHIGPVAQDFHNSLGYGESNTTINTGDADGVLLAAVQALYEQSQLQQAEIEALKAEMKQR